MVTSTGAPSLRATCKSYLFALRVLQGVFDTNLPIEVLSSFNGDLCSLCRVRIDRFDDFLNGSRQGGARLVFFFRWTHLLTSHNPVSSNTIHHYARNFF